MTLEQPFQLVNTLQGPMDDLIQKLKDNKILYSFVRIFLTNC